jgi:ATP-dependent exoDNAse (exonuclease V) alpha subunit
LDKLLVEHHRVTGPRPRYQLPAGTTVLVDEAAMAPTENLARLAALADAQRWRVVLVGDPMQFSAVGRGGMFGLLVDTVGAIELDRVHRFTHPWEAEASLRLRSGDPTVAMQYERHGRLHGGTPAQVRQDAVAPWWDAGQQGQSVVLSAPTNDTVTLLNRAAQARRVTAGRSTLVVVTSRLVATGSMSATRS